MEIPINVALRQWFEKQTRWKSRAEFGRALGIKESTLGDYFTEGARPGPENRRKLFKVTELECFKPREEKEAPAVEQPMPEPEIVGVLWEHVGEQLVVIGEAVTKLGKLLAVPASLRYDAPALEAVAKAQVVEELLYKMSYELHFFKEGSANAREILRQHLDGADVGYVITLLKALFDEEKFQNWLAMTTHEVRR